LNTRKVLDLEKASDLDKIVRFGVSVRFVTFYLTVCFNIYDIREGLNKDKVLLDLEKSVGLGEIVRFGSDCQKVSDYYLNMCV
jgi:hypothetical protein